MEFNYTALALQQFLCDYKKPIMNNPHTFALFVPLLPPLHNGTITFTDADLIRRVAAVLRLEVGERLIFFDEQQALTVTITALKNEKRGLLSASVIDQQVVASTRPIINLYVGLTKREAFEAVVYAATQTGVATITPVLSSKIHSSWLTAKDAPRFTKIAAAAAEQAKQFSLPLIKPVAPFAASVAASSGSLLLADPAGAALLTAIQASEFKATSVINVWIGPEGGFTAAEVAALQAQGAQLVALTPSILRTQDAVLVMLAALRSSFVSL